MTRNLGLIFSEIPTGKPEPGKHLKVEDRPFNLENSSPPEDGLIIRTHYASFDPYQRGRMRDASIKSYAPPFPLNQPIVNSTIATVLKSSNSSFKDGDVVLVPMMGQTEEYSILQGEFVNKTVKKIDNPLDLDIKLFLGALGMPGLTAYSSFYEIGQPKKGETIFISAASGAVGALVAQLAKREGLKVIGSVGSDEKLKYIKDELDVDGGFNYKNEAPADALARLAPNGIGKCNAYAYHTHFRSLTYNSKTSTSRTSVALISRPLSKRSTCVAVS